MNSTPFLKNKEITLEGLHCPKDSLTDVYGWFLQILLACLAFTCLIGMFINKLMAYLEVRKFHFR